MRLWPLLLLLLLPGQALALGTRDSTALSAMSNFAAGRTGILVWQSRRSGPLRIFTCDLDGQNLRQLSADVSGKDQIAPMISPDGTRVIYYQTDTLTESSYYDDHVGAMVMVDASDTKGATAKVLLQEVRTFFECRFARWIDDSTIAYIGKDHHGYTYSLTTGSSTKLFDYPVADFGAIPNRQKTHAIDGKNRVFELAGGKAVQKQDYDGCEGNLSADGLYAYRVEGSSHDFVRMKLSSWGEETFFNNHDSALPTSQNYIYFPQLSPCQRFLALGASPDQHNHFTSDYDIFVVPVDTGTFKKTGSAVKYSFDGALDAYPDIWVSTKKPSVNLPLRVNCGSNDHDVSGWQRDDPFVTGGADWTNTAAVDTSGLSGAAPAEVYRSVRHQSPHGYSLPLPDGTYTLVLHFADAFSGPRSMTYTVEGVEVLKDFDIVSKAGGVNKAWLERFTVTVNDGDGLQIDATGTDDVFEAALEILAAGPTADGGATADASAPAGDADPDAGIATGDGGTAIPDTGGTGATDGLHGGCGLIGAPRANVPWVLVGGLLLLLRRRRQ